MLLSIVMEEKSFSEREISLHAGWNNRSPSKFEWVSVTGEVCGSGPPPFFTKIKESF